MVQVLELGLRGGKASMVLLLPFHVGSLGRLERMLSLEQLEKWLGKLSSMSLALSLPRVSVSSVLSLQVLHHLFANINQVAHTNNVCQLFYIGLPSLATASLLLDRCTDARCLWLFQIIVSNVI